MENQKQKKKNISFTKVEFDLLYQFCDKYITVKEIVTEAEYIDKKSSANIQINKEYRDALSHLVRVFGDILLDNNKKIKNESYYYKDNIHKGIGHLYRAGYDAIDSMSISLRESIEKLADIPASVKVQVVPSYAQKIKLLENFHKKINEYKKEKDIGETSEKIFNDCLEELAKVKEGIFEIKNSIPTMLDLINENVHKIKAENRFSWGQGIALMLSGAIVGALLSSFF